RIVNVVARFPNPEVASILANEVAQTYIDLNLERRVTNTRGAASWLGDQLVDLKTQLEKSEMALYEFKRENNILSVSLEDNRNIVSNEIQRLSEAATEAKTKRIQVGARRKVLNQLSSGDPLKDPIPEIKEHDIIAKLKESYV